MSSVIFSGGGFWNIGTGSLLHQLDFRTANEHARTRILMSTREYSVRIDPHGRTLRVSGDRPVLGAALDAGLNLPHSCKSGHCGSCRARLTAGEIRYPSGRPLGITEEEVAAG